MKPYEWMVAFRYLRARRAEGFISVIAGFSLAGIMLGVATLIVVMAVMNGFRAELLGRILGMKGHVMAYSKQGPLLDYETYINDFLKMDGVAYALPLVEGQVMVTASQQQAGTDRVSNSGGRLGIASGTSASGAMVTGIRPQDLDAKPLLVNSIIAGSLDAFKAGEGVMIGARMAEKLGIRSLGDPVMLISPEGRQTFAGLMPRIKSYPVVAIFNVGMFEYDSAMVFMPFDEAQVFFKLTSDDTKAASNVELVLDDMGQALDVAAQLNQRYGEVLLIRDWQQINSHFFNALQVERNVMFLILSLIIMVLFVYLGERKDRYATF